MTDDLFLKRTSDLALGHDDHLLGQIFYSLNEDCQWHRQWSQALTQTVIEDTPTNHGRRRRRAITHLLHVRD